MSLARRVYRTGSFGRWLAVPTTGVLLAASAIGIASNPPPPPAGWLAWAVFVVPVTYILFRSFFIGVWLSPDRIVARSWFRTFVISTEDVHRCDHAPYTGMLFGYGDSRFAGMLSFTLVDQKVVLVRATIAPKRTTRTQADEIRSFLEGGISVASADRVEP